MTVTETAWARSADAIDFQVTFVTEDSAKSVLDFYRSELGGRGWTVTDTVGETGATALQFESTALGGTWSGSLTTNIMDEDPSYIQTRLQLRIGSAEEQQSSSLSTPAP
jgi:hypothetical protein